MRVERIGDAALYLADCRDVLPTLSAVDAVVTDPPYDIPHKFGMMRTAHNGHRTMQFAWDGPHVAETVATSCTISCKLADAHFWFCGLEQAALISATMREAGIIPKPAVWVKTCPPPAAPGNWWPSGFELAVYGYRSGAWFGDMNQARSNVFRSDSYRHGQPGKVDHPTQKPLGLISRLVAALVPDNGACIDPFMGSGTTGLACSRLGRSFIGIEIHEPYFDIACRRLEAASRQSDMFVPRSDSRAERLPGLFPQVKA